MKLQSLEILGFKSFAKKTTLVFDRPVISVVGPNGSGKSNVVEAFRFVLGEQSIKSLRSKSGADLIFKGSKQLPALSRASVSIVFDNSDKKFSFTAHDDTRVSLAYDTVTISREVARDGVNKYAINGTEVRLKDIVELLASVHIGTSGHHIISQGEADRLLSANSKERRGMIEDALGLKVYQYKIKEAERKLEKTKLNMKEAAALRRELAPRLTFLRKQVEKIEHARVLKEELLLQYTEYMSQEQTAYTTAQQEVIHTLQLKKDALQKAEAVLATYTHTPTLIPAPDTSALTQKLELLRQKKDGYLRDIGRAEGMRAARPAIKESSIPYRIWEPFFSTLSKYVAQAQALTDVYEIKKVISTVQSLVQTTKEQYTQKQEEPTSQIDTQALLDELHQHVDAVTTEIQQVYTHINEAETAYRTQLLAQREKENQYHEAERTVEGLRYECARLEEQYRSHSMWRTRLEEEQREAAILIGPAALRITPAPVTRSREAQEQLRRTIERMKIKLEENGGTSTEVVQEFQDAQERDQFLSRELHDLEMSLSHLGTLVVDLRQTLDSAFREGIEKINHRFQEFFSLLFTGGSALLLVVAEHRKIRDDDERVVSDTDDSLHFEQGVEIHVSLPQKKVKDLHALSGGERSLTSIALLFALTQVNPPPFLVLDETDAALDEANSRRYGDMIAHLAERTQLIVVTHNRETMSRAQALYGVTVGADGGSKLLSVKFEDAIEYAK